LSERRACDAMGFGRASHRYRSRRDPALELRMRLKDLAESRVRYGYRRLHVLLRREGWPVNHKRVYRLYSEEGLSIRTRSLKRRRACRYRSARSEPGTMNDVWAMDFMSEKLFDDQPFRILTIVDCHTREALATSARVNFRAYQVIEELDRIARLRGNRGAFASTTAQNSPADCWTSGPISTRSSWTSPARGDPATTPILRRSTAVSGRSASMLHGSYRWPTPGSGSMTGASTTTNIGRIRPLAT
jgi:transposase InsO family protein